jgi:hypothetical protein
MVLHDYRFTPIFDWLFETPEHDRDRRLFHLNGDWQVLCHEIGHAVVWFYFKGAIGPLSMPTNSTTDVEPGVCLAPRDGKTKTQWSRKYAESYAIRLLAGDIAARLAVDPGIGLSNERITAQDVFIRDSQDRCVLPKRPNPHNDLGKVLLITEKHCIKQFEAWVSTRFSEARILVLDMWPTIQQIASTVQQRLGAGAERTFPGRDLIAVMQAHGIGSHSEIAIELIVKKLNYWQQIKLRIERCRERRKDPSVPKLIFPK